ncbi:MAG TPA: hypothetical protein VJH71_03300 [Candidatus Paceibacterota bacterium]
MITKKTIILLVVLAVGAALVLFLYFSKLRVQEPGEVPTPTVTAEPSATTSVTVTPLPTSQVTQTPDAMNKYPPAECQLTGSIVFISPKLYENKDANIIYKNIDSIARLIFWTISPDDNLSVGPNIFANLPLPDGMEDLTVSLPDSPKSKNYILTAKVTYGVFINRNLEIKESSCTGQIPVELKY